MPETLAPQLEGPHVGDAPPLVALVGTLAPLEPLEVRLMETLHVMATVRLPASDSELEGVHVADLRPIVALGAGIVAPPLSIVLAERVRSFKDKGLRVRRVRQPQP